MADREIYNAWVKRVLGIDPGLAAGLARSAERGRAAKAVVVIDAYRQKIAGASRLAELQKFVKADLGRALRLGGELDAALVELRAQLATAA